MKDFFLALISFIGLLLVVFGIVAFASDITTGVFSLLLGISVFAFSGILKKVLPK